MKKLLILSMLIPLFCQAQFSIPDDKVNHLTFSVVNSAFIKGLSWKVISNNTNWSLKTCHNVSDALAIGGGLLIGHLKERHDQKNDGFYSKKDMLFNGIGTILGTYTIRIVIGRAIPKNRVPIKDVFDMENDPLIAINEP